MNKRAIHQEYLEMYLQGIDVEIYDSRQWWVFNLENWSLDDFTNDSHKFRKATTYQQVDVEGLIKSLEDYDNNHTTWFLEDILPLINIHIKGDSNV